MVKKIDKEKLIKIIKKYLPICIIYLFGSRARKTHLPESDIDLAIDIGEKIDKHILAQIREEIEESTIPFYVDIVDFNNISNDLKKRILKDRVSWQNQ